jgi:N utilization substance protein B
LSRRVAREKALQVLYEVEMGGSDIQEAFENFYGELNLGPHGRKFAQVLASGTWGQREEIDRLIGKYTRRWKIERLAAIDRNILRLAVFEMTTQPDIPHEVSINEAVELAKKYSTDKAASFVNAILDGISKEIRQ